MNKFRKKHYERKYLDRLSYAALILILLVRFSYSGVAGRMDQALGGEQTDTPLNLRYLSEIKVSGGHSIKMSKNPLIPSPQDGLFAAKYQFKESSRKDNVSRRYKFF